MCKPISDGGQRCAAHTRTAYRVAAPGTREWDDAAAAYASTPTGQRELQNHLADLHAHNGDRDAVIATEHALRRGADLRAQSVAIKRAIAEAAERARRAAQPNYDQPLEGIDPTALFDAYAQQNANDVSGYISARRIATDEDRATTDQYLVDAATQAGWSKAELLNWANGHQGYVFASAAYANRRIPSLADRLAFATRRGFVPQ